MIEKLFEIVAKKDWDASEEVDILLRYGHHPHIVKLMDVYEDSEYVYLVEEYCRGGGKCFFFFKAEWMRDFENFNNLPMKK